MYSIIKSNEIDLTELWFWGWWIKFRGLSGYLEPPEQLQHSLMHVCFHDGGEELCLTCCSKYLHMYVYTYICIWHICVGLRSTDCEDQSIWLTLFYKPICEPCIEASAFVMFLSSFIQGFLLTVYPSVFSRRAQHEGTETGTWRVWEECGLKCDTEKSRQRLTPLDKTIKSVNLVICESRQTRG